jgi:hypothetical protein
MNFTKYSAVCFLRRYQFFIYARYFPFFLGSKGSVLSSRQPDARLLPKPDGSNLFSHPFKTHFNTLFPSTCLQTCFLTSSYPNKSPRLSQMDLIYSPTLSRSTLIHSSQVHVFKVVSSLQVNQTNLPLCDTASST